MMNLSQINTKKKISYTKPPEQIGNFEKFTVTKEFFENIFKVSLKKTYQILDLKDKNYSLNEPIPFEIEICEDGYIAKISKLNIYAFGDNLSEAKNELINEILDLYDFLNSENKLGKDPLKWKNFINYYILKK